MTTTYTASCHCGNVTIEAEGTIEGGLACNCSMCARRASLLWFVPRAQVRFKTPESAAGAYLFNKHVITHRFCPACGIHVFGEGTDPKGNAVAAVNLRCVENIDLAALPVHHYDGRAI